MNIKYIVFSMLMSVGIMQASQHEIINKTNKDVQVTIFATSPRGNAQPTLTLKPGSNSYDSQEKCLVRMKIEGTEKMVSVCGSSRITVDKKNGTWQVSVEKIMPTSAKK